MAEMGVSALKIAAPQASWSGLKSAPVAAAATAALSRGLQDRHVQFIAIGGAIGAGLSLAPARPSTKPGQAFCWTTLSAA